MRRQLLRADPRHHGTAAGRMRHAHVGSQLMDSRPRLVQVQDVRLGPADALPAGDPRLDKDPFFRIGLRVPSRRPWRPRPSHGLARRTVLTCSCTITPT
jgi:hypothetical protein